MNKIMIIDPSQAFAQYVKVILTRLGYDCVHIKDPEIALSSITVHRPDLVITEAKLPGASVIDLCQTLKNNPLFASLPVIIVSVDGTFETKLRAQVAGCADYVTKPATVQVIHDVVESHLPFRNKRRYMRASMRFPALVLYDGQTYSLELLSMGEGGVNLGTDMPVPIGQNLLLHLPLPGLQAPLVLHGEVLYHTYSAKLGSLSGMGVKFTGMDLNTMVLLKHYMMNYLSDTMPETPADPAAMPRQEVTDHGQD